MENIENNENMNILEELESRSASPSLQFKNSLKTRVISDFREIPAEGRFFFNERTINFLSVFIVILSVGIVAGAGIISFNNGNQVINVDSVAAVPAAKKPEILEGIIKNNPDALIVQTAAVVSENPSDVASVAQTAQKVSVSSEVKGYNFSFTKATTEIGSSVVCNSNSATTKEIFNYSDDSMSLYRVVNLNQNNNVIDSVQVETKNDVTTSKYSRDGNAQIVFSSNNLETEVKPASFPVSSPQVTTDNINKYFVGGSQNITEVTRDGNKFYVLETQGIYDCNGNVINVVFKNWFIKDDFSLFKKEIYKTNSSESNLIERTTFKVANQQVDFQDIKQNFLQEDKENITDISELDSYQTIETLLDNNSIIIPGGVDTKDLKIANFQDLSLMNKNFYKDDFSYQQSINVQSKAFVKYSVNDLNIELYNSDIFDSSLFTSTKDSISQDIRLGDNFFTGNLYTNTTPVSFAGSTTAKQKLVVTIDGIKYVFSSSNLDSIINNGLDSLLLSDVYYANKI
ncbi:MAG: hypothetical protein ACMG57_04280 [Candidatus Dojkabacteria bacterium]